MGTGAEAETGRGTGMGAEPEGERETGMGGAEAEAGRGTGMGAEAESGSGEDSEFLALLDCSISRSFVIPPAVCSWSAVNWSRLRIICS
jgi:hypothetical protein